MIDIVLAALQKKSAIKSIQRGVASAAGDVTISLVNVNKTLVLSVSKGSAGYVAARGNITGTVSNTRYSGGNNGYSNSLYDSSLSANISGGTTDLTVKEYSARLVNATTLNCDGPVEWQVIEFN